MSQAGFSEQLRIWYFSGRFTAKVLLLHSRPPSTQCILWCSLVSCYEVQESRAASRKLCDAAAVLFGLKFGNNVHYKFKNSQASKARLQSSKHTGAKQNLTQMANFSSTKDRSLPQIPNILWIMVCFRTSLLAYNRYIL